MELKNFFAQDNQGNVIPSPTAYLYQPDTTTLATGLKDKNGNAMANPFTGNAQGFLQFAAPDGDYDLRVSGAGRDFTMRVRFIDSVAGSADLLRSDLASTATSKGAGLAAASYSAAYGPGTVGGLATNDVWVNGAPFSAVGNGTADDTAAIIAARDHALANGKQLRFLKKTYKITDQVVFNGLDVDFGGCTFVYTGATGKFAIVLISNAGSGNSQIAGNKFTGGFTVKQTDFTALTTVTGSATIDPPSLALGSAISNITPNGWTTTVSVPGARPGGYCTATFTGLPEGWIVTARCLANDVVTVTFSNYTIVTADLASGTLNVTCVNNAYHGVCLGGSLGHVDAFKVIGFTGVSVAMGDGTDPISGVALPGIARCYYWDATFNIAPAGGFAFVCPPRNNENTFDISMFPTNLWNDTTPRRASCIYAVALSGLTNGFRRLDVECNPSSTTIYVYGGANNCGMIGAKPAYIEYNGSYVTPPTPAVVADNTTSQINLPFRLARLGKLLTNNGTGNLIEARPTYTVNNFQSSYPQGGRSLVYNGDFAAKLTGWSDFSTGCTISYPGASAWGGNILRIDVAPGGRPNLTQNLETWSGLSLAALRGQVLTLMMRVKTNISNFYPRLNSLGGGVTVGGESDEIITATLRIDPAATSVPLALITVAAVAAGGYIEISMVTAVVGNMPLAVPTRTQPRGTATWNPPSIASGAQATTTISVPGAVAGDMVQLSFNGDILGLTLTGYVSAADTVTAVLANFTGAPVDIASATVTALATKKP